MRPVQQSAQMLAQFKRTQKLRERAFLLHNIYRENMSFICFVTVNKKPLHVRFQIKERFL